MANEKTIIIEVAVPESVYGALVEISNEKRIRLDQLLTIAIGAGLKSVMKIKGCK